MPKIILLQQKVSIKRCYWQFKKDRPDFKQHEVLSRLENIFSVSRRTLETILTTKTENLQVASSGKRNKTDIFTNFMFRKDLQRLIWQYNEKNEYFTLDKSMGYKHREVNGRKILCEQKHVVAAKITFLRTFLQLKNSSENLTFVYLDETWIYQNGSSIRRWIHETDLKSNPTKIKSEGSRFTVLHAGCHLGFLNGCGYLLNSKNNDRDYHKTMDGEIFQNWVVKQLIPALASLKEKCVVVMDNAPYHSVQLDKPPTFSSKKGEMQEWLRNHSIEFNTKFTKKQLWDLIKPFRNNRQKRYLVDETLREHGHEVLRLPPYHCQYNPIEMAWGFCKPSYNKYINSQPSSKDKVEKLWLESLSKCTPEMWQNYCRHCEELISADWRKHMGNLSFENIPPFIISLGESDSESDDEDYDSNLLGEITEGE